MKKLIYSIRKSVVLMVTFLVTGLFFGCQPDPIEIQKHRKSDQAAISNNFVGGAASTEELQLDPIILKGTFPLTKAEYEIAIPHPLIWQADGNPRILMVYAHGYVDPGKPLSLPNDSFSDGMGGQIAIKDFLTGKGIAYAATSYRDNGLVVLDAIEDIKDLRGIIQSTFDAAGVLQPNRILLVGPSEGSLITVLTIEQNPDLFDGAIATCGPIGNFYEQLQYYGDAHVLFKYFFGPSVKGINLGSPKRISKHTMKAWVDNSLKEAIWETLLDDYENNDGNKIRQYLDVSNIPVDRTDPIAVITGILEVLRFPIMATNDASERLGGNPYNNLDRWYGSENDRKLNLTVERIKRSDWHIAEQTIKDHYETDGSLLTDLVTMHTEFDHVSLSKQLTDYGMKANSFLKGQIMLYGKYGHCNFTVEEIEIAIATLLSPI